MTPTHLDAYTLAELGAEARHLLFAGDIAGLSQRFGYALAFGRDPADAIRDELASCLAHAGAVRLVAGGWETPCVSYFKPNGNGLLALVECFAPTDKGTSLRIELIVTSNSTEIHAILEQLSPAV